MGSNLDADHVSLLDPVTSSGSNSIHDANSKDSNNDPNANSNHDSNGDSNGDSNKDKIGNGNRHPNHLPVSNSVSLSPSGKCDTNSGFITATNTGWVLLHSTRVPGSLHSRRGMQPPRQRLEHERGLLFLQLPSGKHASGRPLQFPAKCGRHNPHSVHHGKRN